MAKLKILRGIPASGKTTYARLEVKDSGNSGRVNRDDLRAMLFDSVWSGKRESVVVECEKAIAKVLLANKMVPIIDDTNLTNRHKDMWVGFAKEQGIAFETVDCNQSLEVCVQRDHGREKPVGLAVIHRMALFAGLINFGDKKIVICDIDGTLADGTERQHYLDGPRKDWNRYFSEIANDKPVELVVKWLSEWKKTHTICIVSGRPDTYQNPTICWLEKYGIQYDYLFMRPGSSTIPDTEIKKNILDHMPKHLIECVLDDRPNVVRLWRSQGLKVYPVRGQCPEF